MTTSCNFIMFLFGTFRLIVHIHSQGSSISFSPNSPLCIEEEVEMLCFVETSEQFAFSTAFLSINSSSPFTISELNTNSSKCADLSLYSANTDGLNVSRNRAGIRLIIHNYQPSDSHTIFGCHGMFPNISYNPPSSPVLSTSLSTLSASQCRSVSVSWLTPATDRTLTQFYLYRDSSLISTLSNTTTQYTDTDPLILNAAYLYSIAVASCAGNSTMSYATIKIPAPLSLSSSPANISVLLNGTIGISVIQIPQLTYEIILYKNDVTSLNQTVDTIQDPTHSFSSVFSFDTCYYTRTRAKNCTHETDTIFSRGFILYRLNNTDIRNNTYFRTNANNVTIFQFTSDDVANISCSSEDYESPFIPRELFQFHLVRKGDNIHNISNVTVISPFIYEFELPEKYYNCTIEDTFMRMTFRGENMSNTDILFCTNKASEHSTGNITLALALGLVFGIILISVLIAAIVICIITVWKKRRKSHSKQILTSQSSFQD